MGIIKSKKLILLLHLFLGYILYLFPFISTYFGLLILMFATYYILSSKQYTDLMPLNFSAYIIGVEVLLRMSKSSLIWEFGKYSIIYFIILALLRKRFIINLYWPILIYFILLLPSIINVPITSINLWRQDVSFNLSGPLCLAALVIYLYNLKLTKRNLADVLYYALLPILSMSLVIILKMPDIESYKFSPYSDPITSGGYGPNQVSTIFGFMIAGLAFGQIFKIKITESKVIDIACLFLFIGLGLITFSRGGLFAAFISIIFCIISYHFSSFNKVENVIKMILILVVAIGTWFYVVKITEGAISQRYGLSQDDADEKFKLDLSGRAEIYLIDIRIFADNFFSGVGPGQGNQLRYIYGYGKHVAAHTEFSRMLAEHGIFGLLSLISLFGIAFNKIFINSSINNKSISLLFGSLALLTMLHAAMRISMPCLAFAFIFPKYYD